MPETKQGGGEQWLRRFVLTVPLMAIALIILESTVGHRLLAALHRGENVPLLSGLLPMQPDMSVWYYVGRLDHFFYLGLRVFLLCWLLALVVMLRGCRRPWDSTGARLAVVGLSAVLVLLLAPWPLVKWVCLVLLVGSFMQRDWRFSRERSTLLLVSIFGFAYLLAPYALWLRGGVLQAAGVCVLALLCVWWARRSAGCFGVRRSDSGDLVALGLLGCVLWGLHRAALVAPLPFLGDEDYHVMQILHLVETPVPLWLACIAFCAWLLVFARLENRSELRRLAMVVLCVLTICGLTYVHCKGTMLRYPFVSRWVQAIPVVLLYPFGAPAYQESLYRLVPLGSLLVLGWLVSRETRVIGWGPSVAAALAVITVPVALYFGATLCLELPAIILMTWVCLRSERLLRASADSVMDEPAWYALLGVGFIKETFIPFIVAFIACRMAAQCFGPGRARRISKEVQVAVLVMLPSALYLAVRWLGPSFRGYGGGWGNLVNVRLYGAWLSSIWEQFGLLVVVAGVGCVFAAIKGRRLWLLFHTACCLAGCVFFLADEAKYVGFSRFNLFFYPLVISMTVSGVKALYERARCGNRRSGFLWKAMSGLLVSSVVMLNLVMSPVNADGTTMPGWGEGIGGLAERDYPYDAALEWLRMEDTEASLLIAGSGYPYFLDFYFRKMNWRPRYEQKVNLRGLAMSLEYAGTNSFDWVLRQGVEVTPPVDDPGYEAARVFSNDALSLTLFRRTRGVMQKVEMGGRPRNGVESRAVDMKQDPPEASGSGAPRL